tara:strand:- start:623 stop:919 length:297 start_codon:yes stop_codon:yes gene_type:complete
MSTLINFWIDVNSLPKDKFKKGKNGKVFYNFTANIEDVTNEYGQNVSIFQEQTKEERDNKIKRNYHGNGSVVWTDGNIVKAEKKKSANYDNNNNDLPF